MSSRNCSEKYKLNFKMALDSLTIPPQMKHCKNQNCKAMFLIMGKKLGDVVDCPECHKQYVLRQEVVLKTVIDPLEAV